MNVRRSIAVAAVALAAPVMSSCGVNFGAPTDQVYNAAAGVDDRSGAVDVLNALIVSGVDGKGTVVAGLVNNQQGAPDYLTGIGPGDPGAESLTVTGPQRTKIPAGGTVSLATIGKYFATGPSVVPGKFVKIRFSFENAQAVTVDVPVVSRYYVGGDYESVPLPK